MTKEISLYIHLPFCKKKCNYCDFVSYAGKEGLIDKYVEALCGEIQTRPKTKDQRLKSIYFGGGTPTLLKPRHFEKILKILTPAPPPSEREGTSLSSSGVRALEISIEANPGMNRYGSYQGTADKAKLKALRQLGINRISIGAQSFNDEHLKVLGRIHNAKDILRFYDDARTAGFDNINLDLIFALPNQTLDEWKNDLQAALSLNPNHLSTYNLELHENSLLWQMTHFQPPASKPTSCSPLPHFQLPPEEEDLAMYEYTIETLTDNGYKHYEISNFAKPGFECQHNIVYWKNGNYIGIGAGAHSHVNGKRWANSDSIEKYLEVEARSSAAITKPVSSVGYEVRNEQQASNIGTGIVTDQRESLFMGLRLLDGLETEKFKGFENEVAELIEDGLLTRENNHYKLSRKGLYLANEVFVKFI